VMQPLRGSASEPRWAMKMRRRFWAA